MSWSECRGPLQLRLAPCCLALLLLALQAGGCGFRLQGAASYPDFMATTFIRSSDRYTPFYRGLHESLERGGVEVVDSTVAAGAVINIEEDRTGQKVLTVSGRNVPTEYDVFYSVTYSVWRDGVQILPARTLVKRQDYTYDTTLVLGKSREEQELREAIAAELVRQVSLQLARL